MFDYKPPDLGATPDEAELEELLQGFQLSPGENFYKLISSQAWFQGSTNQSARRKLQRFRTRVVYVVLGIIGVIGFLLFTPAGRTFADEISKFFQFSRTESYVESIPNDPLPTSIPDFPYSLYLLSVEEVESLAGFDVKFPNDLSHEWEFHGARYEEDLTRASLFFTYSREGIDQPEIYMFIRQLRGEFDQDQPWEFCPNGTLIETKVGKWPAEMLVGAVWMTYSPPEPGTQREWVCEKVNDNQVRILRWKEDVANYEISADQPEVHEEILTHQDIIDIAESISDDQ